MTVPKDSQTSIPQLKYRHVQFHHLEIIGRASLTEPLRQEKNDNLLFENGHMLKRHAELRWRKRDVYLMDLSSLGTMLNNELLVPGLAVKVAVGDTIGFAVSMPLENLKKLVVDAQISRRETIPLKNARTQFEVVVTEINLKKFCVSVSYLSKDPETPGHKTVDLPLDTLAVDHQGKEDAAEQDTGLADKDIELADEDIELADEDTGLADEDTELADNDWSLGNLLAIQTQCMCDDSSCHFTRPGSHVLLDFYDSPDGQDFLLAIEEIHLDEPDLYMKIIDLMQVFGTDPLCLRTLSLMFPPFQELVAEKLIGTPVWSSLAPRSAIFKSLFHYIKDLCSKTDDPVDLLACHSESFETESASDPECFDIELVPVPHSSCLYQHDCSDTTESDKEHSELLRLPCDEDEDTDACGAYLSDSEGEMDVASSRNNLDDSDLDLEFDLKFDIELGSSDSCASTNAELDVDTYSIVDSSLSQDSSGHDMVSDKFEASCQDFASVGCQSPHICSAASHQIPQSRERVLSQSDHDEYKAAMKDYVNAVAMALKKDCPGSDKSVEVIEIEDEDEPAEKSLKRRRDNGGNTEESFSKKAKHVASSIGKGAAKGACVAVGTFLALAAYGNYLEKNGKF